MNPFVALKLYCFLSFLPHSFKAFFFTVKVRETHPGRLQLLLDVFHCLFNGWVREWMNEWMQEEYLGEWKKCLSYTKSLHHILWKANPKEDFALLSRKTTIDPSAVAHTCNPSYLGGWDQEDQDLRPARAEFTRPHLQNNQSKMDWRCDSSGSVPAL
jgi:hypothetical protein